jgi:hypothetical protein
MESAPGWRSEERKEWSVADDGDEEIAGPSVDSLSKPAVSSSRRISCIRSMVSCSCLGGESSGRQTRCIFDVSTVGRKFATPDRLYAGTKHTSMKHAAPIIAAARVPERKSLSASRTNGEEYRAFAGPTRGRKDESRPTRVDQLGKHAQSGGRRSGSSRERSGSELTEASAAARAEGDAPDERRGE